MGAQQGNPPGLGTKVPREEKRKSLAPAIPKENENTIKLKAGGQVYAVTKSQKIGWKRLVISFEHKSIKRGPVLWHTLECIKLQAGNPSKENTNIYFIGVTNGKVIV